MADLTGSDWLSIGGTAFKGLGNAVQSFGWASANRSSARANKMLAVEAKKKAAYDVTTQRLHKRRLLSAQQFAAGFAGVQLEGSPRDVLDTTARELALNEEMTTREGEVQSAMYLQEAKAAQKAERANKGSGFMNLLSAGLGIGARLMGI